MKRVLLFTILTIVAISGAIGLAKYQDREISQKPNVERGNVQLKQVKAVSPPTVEELLVATNNERVAVGLAPLKLDSRLNSSALLKLEDMDRNDYYNHVSPIDGKHGYEYAKEAMPECTTVSENLLGRQASFDANKVVGAWMASKPHRATILDSKYQYVGFGVSPFLVVQHFCSI